MNDLLDEQPISIKRTLQFRLWVILIWTLVFATGCVFKVMHWPLDEILLIFGAAGFMAYSFSFLLLCKQRSNIMIICTGISLLWIIILLLGFIFKNGYPFSVQGLKTQGALFGTFFLIHFVRLSTIKFRRELSNKAPKL